ncbi:MAG: nuclear transport factor 2 family protein [Chloroflexi bacterium]|nr:nuclear transport factor 2 family protein [Chloroflexota bacterium]
MARACGAVLLLVLLVVAAPAEAQQWDPASTVVAYREALARGDVDSALRLFDDNGSATDPAGHNYRGPEGLREFLQANGFLSANVRISNEQVRVIANRAIWTYTCSCTSGPTEVRIVINDQSKITVFAMFPARTVVPSRATSNWPAFALGGTLLGAVLVWLTWRKRVAPTVMPPRAAQGRLIAALREARSSGVLSEPATNVGGRA